jgi:hypothetical protein
MFKKFDRSYRSTREHYKGQHRSEHWYVDNQVYFVTGKCRDGYSAFASEEAKGIFWDRFDHYAKVFEFEPSVVSLLNNHYHFVGYVKLGEQFKNFMQRLHGSVAKLVNDLLPERRVPFWRNGKGKEYYDGCLRDEKQHRLSYRYTHQQARRHLLMDKFELYPHTHVYVPIEVALQRAKELDAHMPRVPYKRYEHHRA